MSGTYSPSKRKPSTRDSVSHDEETAVKIRKGVRMRTGFENAAYNPDGDQEKGPEGSNDDMSSRGTSNQHYSDDDEDTMETDQGATLSYEFIETGKGANLYSAADCFNDSKKVIKGVFAFVLGCLILGCGVVSAGTLLYISSNMNKYVNFKRTGMVNNTYEENKECSDGPMNDCGQCGVPICIMEEDPECTQKETVRWIWGMFLCQCVPYFVMFLRSLWRISFKRKKAPTLSVFFIVLLIEMLSVIGMFLLLYIVLPHMDAMRGLLLLPGIGFIPSLLKLFNRTEKKKYFNLALDILGFMGQLLAITGLTVMFAIKGNPIQKDWGEICPASNEMSTPSPTVISFSNYQMSNTTTAEPTLPPLIYNYVQFGTLPQGSEIWVIPVALILISLGYWENFVDANSVLCFNSVTLQNFRYDINQYRTKLYLWISLCKIITSFLLIVIQHAVGFGNTALSLDMVFATSNFYENKCDFYGEGVDSAFQDDWLLSAVIQISVGIICFYFADLAIKGYMQRFSFSLPIVLVTPVTFSLLVWACMDCDSHWDFGTETFWNCYSGKDNLGEHFIGDDFSIWLGIIWFPSFLLVTRHIWSPKAIRMAKIDKLFCYPMPCGATLMQSLPLIRRRNDDEKLERIEDKTQNQLSDLNPALLGDMRASAASTRTGNQGEKGFNVEDLKVGYVPSFEDEKPGEIPFIYMCATMWHENEKEMLQMLKSIFRVNLDQCAKEKAFTLCSKKNLFYRFEVNIFFDDAFEAYAEGQKYYKVNSFVKDFVNTINLAASEVMNRPCTVGYPTRYETPYGGRLEWTMPLGKNKIVMHLKDKQKIRHKKRWSQIMYMHRILGLGILEQPVPDHHKEAVAQNTYILALDGDIDFKPDAVILLLDMMRTNPDVAASCGRIHPIGSGPMVWYQVFEYSVSHWLQKATEHVLGCVLCSPGCFSLFRGKALMDENVVQTYTTKSTKPLHFVQYDQGEDRWLCTLLLQQGYRVEYSAAADAYTYAPEGFNEFYNQRRRWITSTFANLLDLLRSGRVTASKNQNISFLYIMYQALLFAASVLGPATIFLLVVGAFEVGFGTPAIWSTILGLIPILTLMILCFKAKESTQLFFAALFSVVFAVLQMLVIVGISKQMSDQGICSPTSIFTLFVLGTFVLAAIIHPQEFTNLFHGFLYYLLIPCMYLLLIVYSLCNLNNVAWGTRMVKAPTTEAQPQATEEIKKLKKASTLEKTLAYLNLSQKTSSEGGVGIDCSPFCIFKCCVTGKEHSIRDQIEIAKTFDEINEASNKPPEKEAEETEEVREEELIGAGGDVDINKEQIQSIAEQTWIQDSEVFHGGEIQELDQKEVIFWDIIINEYLYPLDNNKEEKQKLTEGLKELRNKTVFSFFLIDALLIVLIVGLQESGVAVEWTCGGTQDPISLDPIGFLFVFVFGGLLAIQVIGMLIHRMFTFMQIIAQTTIGGESQAMIPGELGSSQKDEDFTDEQVIELIKNIQRFDLDPDTSIEESDTGLDPDDHKMKRRNTIFNTDKRNQVEVLTNEDMERTVAARFVVLSSSVMARKESFVPNPPTRKASIHGMPLEDIRRKSSWNAEAIKAMREKHKLTDQDIDEEKEYIITNFAEQPEKKRRDSGIPNKLFNRRPSGFPGTHPSPFMANRFPKETELTSIREEPEENGIKSSLFDSKM